MTTSAAAVFQNLEFHRNRINPLNSGNGGAAVFIDQAASVSIDGCEFRNHTVLGSGGAIVVSGTLSRLLLRFITAIGNHAMLQGGFLRASDGAEIIIEDSQLTQNSCVV